jgi:hypothetical protein
MSTRFERTVAALAGAIIHERATAAVPLPAEEQAVARFLLETHARMPHHLRAPLRILTHAFAAWCSVLGGAAFHRQPVERRVQHIRAWRTSRLAPRRDLIRFYETLAVFGWYSERYSEDYLHA